MPLDAHRFDALARALATGHSRRRLLAGLAGGALALAGRAADAQACRGKGSLCTKNANCCSGRCDTTNANPFKRNRCTCPAGTTECGGACADCCIGGVAIAAGTTNPANGCQACLPATSATAWSNRPSGTLCGPAPTCGEGVTTQSTCDGAGSCAEETIPCHPFACNAAGTGCATTCTPATAKTDCSFCTTTSDDCQIGFLGHCPCEGGVCVEQPEDFCCSCGRGSACVVALSQCCAVEQVCQDPSDGHHYCCPGGYYCGTEANGVDECRPLGRTCTIDDDCLYGEACRGGTCCRQGSFSETACCSFFCHGNGEPECACEAQAGIVRF